MVGMMRKAPQVHQCGCGATIGMHRMKCSWCELVGVAVSDAMRDLGAYGISVIKVDAEGVRAVPATSVKRSGTVFVRECCDCPGCNDTRSARILSYKTHPTGVANAIRFAGLNTPDRKQMGVAQTLCV